MKRILIAAVIPLALLTACGKPEEKKDDDSLLRRQMSETYVDTMRLEVMPFQKQVVCNGRLSARDKSDLRFASDGVTLQIHVKEGQHVAKGQLISHRQAHRSRLRCRYEGGAGGGDETCRGNFGLLRSLFPA